MWANLSLWFDFGVAVSGVFGGIIAGIFYTKVKIKVQEAKFQTVVVAGSLNPKWNQSFKFQLDDNPYDDEIECEVFDFQDSEIGKTDYGYGSTFTYKKSYYLKGIKDLVEQYSYIDPIGPFTPITPVY